jgi:hypothetical protein
VTYVLTLHGVLQQPNGAPNPQGILLYRALSAVDRLIVLGGLDRERDEWFLATHDLRDHVNFVAESITKGPTELMRRQAQIGALRAQGIHIDLAIEPDPEIIAALHDDGIPTLLYLHPKFTHPAFRPDYESVAKPWDALVASVHYQERLKAAVVIPTEEEDDE